MLLKAPALKKTWNDAAVHLSKVDRRLAEVIKRVGPCAIEPRKDYFASLCRAIFAQQLSTKVAAALVNRFRNEFPGRRPTPARVRELIVAGGDDAIRRCGLSRQKAKYLVDLSDHFLSNRIATRKIRNMTDEQVIDALVEVNGIGRWTAEMFLIFVLNRPDVLPVDDLGLREGVREIYGMRQRPTPAQLIKLGEPWRPYRSIATWYIWRRGSGGVE